MQISFKTLGPFHIGNTSQRLEAKEFKEFWKKVELEHPGLQDAIGVYVLAVAVGKASRPVYVGKAEHGFRARLKPNHDAFRKARNNHENKELSIVLIARSTSAKERFVRQRKGKESLKSVNDLEVLMIREFLLRGFELSNSREVTFFQNLIVPGYLHDDEVDPTRGSDCLKRMLRAKHVKAPLSKTS